MYQEALHRNMQLKTNEANNLKLMTSFAHIRQFGQRPRGLHINFGAIEDITAEASPRRGNLFDLTL